MTTCASEQILIKMARNQCRRKSLPATTQELGWGAIVRIFRITQLNVEIWLVNNRWILVFSSFCYNKNAILLWYQYN